MPTLWPLRKAPNKQKSGHSDARIRRVPTMSPQEITRLLADWGGGDRSALEKLLPLVHAELRQIARRQISQERRGHTLQATALINEAYL